MSEIDLWSEVPDWEDEDGCFNGTMFDFTFQKKLYLQVYRSLLMDERYLGCGIWFSHLNIFSKQTF